MKKFVLFSLALTFLSCGSTLSFKNFYNNHKNDLGVTYFQVPRFLKSLVQNISPDMNSLFGNLEDLKFITFKNISPEKKQELVSELNAITNKNYTDILRVNTLEHTKIISVVEHGDVVRKAIIFNSRLNQTSAFYITGNFDSNMLKNMSENGQFETLTSKLLNNHKPTGGTMTPSFNPNN